MDNRRPAEAGARRATVAMSLVCRGCGYNLRGLPLDHACPECGLAVVETVRATVDPEASRLPALADARGVGDGLFWLMKVLLIGALLVTSRPMALFLDRMIEAPDGIFVRWTPPFMYLLAGVVFLSGWWSVRRFRTLHETFDGGVGARYMRMMWLGLALTGLTALTTWVLEWFLPGHLLASDANAHPPGRTVARFSYCLGVGLTFGGVQQVLAAIGARSRAYRTSQGGRQSIHAMLAALIVIVMGEIIRLLSDFAEYEFGELVGGLLVVSSSLMLVIGLAYLVLNAWWIRRDLRRPPPRWSEVVARAGTQRTDEAYEVEQPENGSDPSSDT